MGGGRRKGKREEKERGGVGGRRWWLYLWVEVLIFRKYPKNILVLKGTSKYILKNIYKKVL